MGALALTSLTIAPLEPSPAAVHASAPAAPLAPEVLRHGGASGTTATVRWTRPLTGTAPSSYVVRAIPHDGDPDTASAALTATVAAGDRTPTATLTGLAPGVAYDITVTSVGAGGATTVVANPTTWLPSPTDGLALWLDVSHPDTVTAAAGQLVSLVDRSDAGNDTSQVSQPWNATGGYRGRAVTWGFPGLAINDTGQGSITVADDASLTHQGSYTVLMALHQTTAVYPIYAQFLFKAQYLPQFGDCYPTQYQLAKFGAPAELYGYHGADGNNCSSFARQNRDGITPTGDQVIGRRVRFDAGNNLSHSEFRRANQWDTTASIAGRTPTANANLVMTTPHMSEVLLFTTALDDVSVSAIEAYLDAKVPLPAPTVSAVTTRADGFDVAFVPGHSSSVLAAGRYQVSLDGGVSWQEREEGYADAPLRVTGLAPGTTATVSVRAVSSAGYGAASAPVTVTVPVPPPDVSSVLPLTAQPVGGATTTTTTTTTTTHAPPSPEPLSVDGLAALPEGVVAAGVLTVRPGDTLTLKGADFVPGEDVQAVMASEVRVLGTARADDAGDVSLTVVVPVDTPVGPHTVALYAPVSGRGARQSVTVVERPSEVAEPPADALPATGSRGTAALLGVIVLAAGVIVAASRQRGVNRSSR